jgi:hypothetical protein
MYQRRKQLVTRGVGKLFRQRDDGLHEGGAAAAVTLMMVVVAAVTLMMMVVAAVAGDWGKIEFKKS